MLNIALISDTLTFECLDEASNVKYITPKNYKKILSANKIDFLFVESTWLGLNNQWRYKVATSPERKVHRILDFIMQRNTNSLSKVVSFAKEKNIPTIFWNKEDPVHYDRFIASATLFDYIFTVDEGSIINYQKHTSAIINTLPFAIQTSLHNSNNLPSKTNGKANFVGSYGNPNHVTRKYWQDLMFDKVPSVMSLDVYDRNSDRPNMMYRFPKLNNTQVLSKVTNAETANIYKNYDLSLNVNTVETSTTMLSRRLVEIIACAGVAITNDSPAVQKYFKDYCYVVKNEDDLFDVLNSIKDGIPQSAKDRALAGAEYIKNHHTWDQRLQFVLDIISSKPK
jgi:spore maturation protein CgeB